MNRDRDDRDRDRDRDDRDRDRDDRDRDDRDDSYLKFNRKPPPPPPQPSLPPAASLPPPPQPSLPLAPSLAPPPPPLPRSITDVPPMPFNILEMTVNYDLIIQEITPYNTSPVLTQKNFDDFLKILNDKLKEIGIKWEPTLAQIISKTRNSKSKDYFDRTLAMHEVILEYKTHIDNWLNAFDYALNTTEIVILDMLNLLSAIGHIFGVYDERQYEILRLILFHYIGTNLEVKCLRFIIGIQNHLFSNPYFLTFIRDLRDKLDRRCIFTGSSDIILILPAPDRGSGDDLDVLTAYARIKFRNNNIQKPGVRLHYKLLTNDYYGDFKSIYLQGNENIKNFTAYLKEIELGGSYTIRAITGYNPINLFTPPHSRRSGGTIKNKKLLKHNYHKKSRKMSKKTSHKKHKTTIKAHRKYSKKYKKHRTYKSKRV